MFEIAVLVCAGLVSAAAIRLSIAAAPHLRLVDHPGEHKLHEHATPFVGGVGIFFALLGGVAMIAAVQPVNLNYLLALCAVATIMFATGLVDDIRRVSFRTRLFIQALAAMVMIELAGVRLADLGGILFTDSLPLGWLTVPFTVFATVGVINALNMTDGMDGLAGSISFVSLALIASVALVGGKAFHVLLSLALMGGVFGFLSYNLRYGAQRRARVFLGDNGSMLLGLVFAWLLIDLTQGEAPTMPPVAAVWILAMPLMDTVGVMLRRIWLGKTPFTPDRHHLHHLLLRAGYRVEDIVALIAVLQFVLAISAVLLLAAGASEGVMFLAFLGLFAGYFYVTVRPWRFVPAMRRLHSRLGLLPAASCGIYFGHCAAQDAEKLMHAVSRELGQITRFRIRIFERTAPQALAGQQYGIVEVALENDAASVDDIRRYARKIKRGLREHQGLYVRPFIERNSSNDPRAVKRNVGADQRRSDRRAPATHILVMEAVADVDNGNIVDLDINKAGPHREVPDAAGLPHIPRDKRGANQPTSGATVEPMLVEQRRA